MSIRYQISFPSLNFCGRIRTDDNGEAQIENNFSGFLRTKSEDTFCSQEIGKKSAE